MKNNMLVVACMSRCRLVGRSDLFTLGGLSFVWENSNIKKPDDRWKELFRGYKIGPSTTHLFLFRSYGLFKVHNCIVVVGFGAF